VAVRSDGVMLARATVIEVGATSSSPETATLDQAQDQAVLAIWHAQQAHSWTANLVAGFEKFLTDAELLTTFLDRRRSQVG
jgi:hypothetical protein